MEIPEGNREALDTSRGGLENESEGIEGKKALS